MFQTKIKNKFIFILIITLILIFSSCDVRIQVKPLIDKEEYNFEKSYSITYKNVSLSIPESWNYIFDFEYVDILSFNSSDENISGFLLSKEYEQENKEKIDITQFISNYLYEKPSHKILWIGKKPETNSYLIKCLYKKEIFIYYCLIFSEDKLYELQIMNSSGKDDDDFYIKIFQSFNISKNEDKVSIKRYGISLSLESEDFIFINNGFKNGVFNLYNTKDDFLLSLYKVKPVQTSFIEEVNNFTTNFILRFSNKDYTFKSWEKDLFKGKKIILFRIENYLLNDNETEVIVDKYYFEYNNYIYELIAQFKSEYYSTEYLNIIEEIISEINFD